MQTISNSPFDPCTDLKGVFEDKGSLKDSVIASPYCDGINIFIWPKNAAGLSGSFNIVSKSVLIGGYVNNINHSVLDYWLSHEIGHCLGLFHTHHGTAAEVVIKSGSPVSNCGIPDFNQCSEAVMNNGTLGPIMKKCGDYIEDTPPDPGLYNRISDNCQIINPTSVAPYQPLINNIMSYTHSFCLESFTNGQGSRMRYYIENCDYVRSIQMRGYSTGKISTQPLTSTSNSYCYGINYAPNKLHIAGKVEIDMDFTFSEKEITPLKDAEIIVKSGKTLTIEKCNIQTCIGMWKGIIVESGATLIIRNSYIADALYAVEGHDGSTILLEDNTFDKNLISVFVSPSNGFIKNIDITLRNNLFECSGNLKSNQNPLNNLNYDGKSFAGVYVNDLNAIILDGIFRTDHWDSNKFKNLHNGIIANNANVHSIFSYFESIKKHPYNPNNTGYGIRQDKGSLYCEGMGKNAAVSFSNCTNAIWVNNAYLYVFNNEMSQVNVGVHIQNSQFQAATIFNNNMYAYEYGIKAVQNTFYENAYFFKNTITLLGGIAPELAKPLWVGIYADQSSATTSFNIFNNIVNVNGGQGGIYVANARRTKVVDNQVYIEEPNKEHFGIKVDANSGMLVNCNYIEDKTKAVSKNLYRTIGISAANCMNTDWSCNTMRKTDVGLNYIGVCDAATVKGNEMDNKTTGLLMGMLPDIGVSIIGPQPGSNIDLDRGNLWSNNGNYQGAAAWHIGGFSTAQASPFIVDSQEDSRFLPSSIDPPSGWFFDIANPELSEKCSNASFQNSTLCNTFNTTTFTHKNSSVYRSIAQGKLLSTQYSEATQRIGELHLWEQLQEVNNDDIPDDFRSFYEENKSNTLDRLYWLSKGVNEVTHLNAEEGNTQQSKYAKLKQYLVLIDSIAQLLFENKNLSKEQKQSLTSTKKAHLSTVAKLGTEINTMELQANKSKSNNISLSRELANSLEIKSEFDQYIVEVNQAQLYLFENDSLSNDLLEKVNHLGNICPLAGGESVYKARAILSYLNGYATEFDDATLCGKSNEILNKVVKNVTEIQVFPNPAKDQIFIKYTIKQDAQFEVWDILGKKIANGKLSKDANLQAIETASFPNGSYFIKIFDEVNNLNISTINIIH